MSSYEELIGRARESIVVANLVVDKALAAVAEGDARGVVLSLENEVAVVTRFLTTVLPVEDSVVVAAVSMLRLAGRKTGL